MLEGVNGNNQIDGPRYSMQSLNIKSESRAASIFNEIDMSDGTKDNSLTQDQVNRFRKVYLGNMPQDELKDVIGNKAFKKLSESYLQKFVNEDGTYNLNELSNSLLKVLGSDYKMESKNDEIKLIRDALKELTGNDFSKKETKKILELLDFQQKTFGDLSIQNKGKDEIDGNFNTYGEIVAAFYPELIEKHGFAKAIRMFKDAAGIDPKAAVQDSKIKIPQEIDGIKRKEEGFQLLEENRKQKSFKMFDNAVRFQQMLKAFLPSGNAQAEPREEAVKVAETEQERQIAGEGSVLNKKELQAE